MNNRYFMKNPIQDFFKFLDEQGKIKRLSAKDSYEVAKKIENSIRDFSRRYAYKQGKFLKSVGGIVLE